MNQRTMTRHGHEPTLHTHTHTPTNHIQGVYTMAFLSVMGFFAAGTLVLRVKRPELQRPFICPL